MGSAARSALASGMRQAAACQPRRLPLQGDDAAEGGGSMGDMLEQLRAALAMRGASSPQAVPPRERLVSSVDLSGVAELIRSGEHPAGASCAAAALRLQGPTGLAWSLARRHAARALHARQPAGGLSARRGSGTCALSRFLRWPACRAGAVHHLHVWRRHQRQRRCAGGAMRSEALLSSILVCMQPLRMVLLAQLPAPCSATGTDFPRLLHCAPPTNLAACTACPSPCRHPRLQVSRIWLVSPAGKVQPSPPRGKAPGSSSCFWARLPCLLAVPLQAGCNPGQPPFKILRSLHRCLSPFSWRMSPCRPCCVGVSSCCCRRCLSWITSRTTPAPSFCWPRRDAPRWHALPCPALPCPTLPGPVQPGLTQCSFRWHPPLLVQPPCRCA